MSEEKQRAIPEVSYYILDDTITEPVFEQVIHESGNFIGIGRFRPENGGYYGRYVVDSITWQEASDMAAAAE